MKPTKLLGLTAMFVLAAGAAKAQWTGADVGGPGYPGSHTVNGDGTIFITGGGNDIWDAADKFYYYYRPVSGQWWNAVVKVQAMDGPDWWTKAELMVRRPDQTILPLQPQGNDQHISAMCTRTNGQNEIGPQYRGSRGGGSGDGAKIVGNSAPPYPNAWLRIERFGATFSLYKSSDGTTWTKFFSQDTSTTANGFDGSKWEDTVLVGVAVTGHNDTSATLGSALVSDLTVTPNASLVVPTAAGITTQPVDYTTYVGAEATFKCVATNNGTAGIWNMQYKWYKNGTLVSTNPMGANYTFLTTAADNGAQITCVANVEPLFASIVTPVSATAVLTVNTGVSYTNGVKEEIFLGASRLNTEIGSVPVANIINVAPTLDIGGFGDSLNNFSRRVSGWFKAPETASYVFWVAGDDDTDLFLGTGEDPASKRLIAQETAWSGRRNWVVDGPNNAANIAQKSSQTWSPDGGITIPYASGIPLSAGAYYYIEAVLRDGNGGDNLGVTYRTVTELALDPMTNGAPSTLTNNLFLKSWAATYINITAQPTNKTVFEGFAADFYVTVATDSEFTPLYQWYKTGVGAIAGATAARYRISTTQPSDSGSYYVVTSTQEGGLSATSSTVTLTVQQSVFEKGVAKNEVWLGVANRNAARDGTLGTPSYTTTSPKFAAAVNNECGNSYTRRLSALFVPPTTGDYVFFINSDDGAELYISTDNTPAKRYGPIAQETSWADPLQWVGGGSTISQKRSDQWSPDGGVTVPYASGIHLLANTRYYMEAIQSETGGGDNVEVTYKLLSEIDPVNGSDTKMTGTQIGTMAVRANWVAFTQQPVNTTVEPMATAVFTAAGTSDSLLAIGSDRARQYSGVWSDSTNVFVQFQWQKNGVDIPGATDGTLSYGPVLPSDNGAQFVCKMRALGYVTDMTSQTPMWSNSVPVTLTLAPAAVYEPGYAQYEFWGNGNNPSRTTIEAGAAGAPTILAIKPGFASQIDGGGDAPHANNYGSRLRGWFTPPANGDYVFFMTSDDDADLFINPLGVDPQGKKLLARETTWSDGPLNWNNRTPENRRTDQFIDPIAGTTLYPMGIPMVVGQKYYMELVHHEGGGGDYATVTYKLYSDLDPANGDQPKLINSAAMGTYVPKSTTVTITQQPQNVTLNTVGPATFTADGTCDALRAIQNINADYNNGQMVAPVVRPLYQWQRNGADIPGATTPTYTLPFVTAADNGAQFVCKVRGLGYSDAANNPIWLNSNPATLTFADSAAPTLAYAAYYSSLPWTNQNIVTVRFSEAMDAASLLAATYSIPGATVQSVLVNSNDLRTVRLVLSAAPTLPVNVTVTGAKDYTGNTIAAGASTAIQSVPLISRDIGHTNLDGSMDPAYPSYFWVNGPNAYTIAAEGSDIWETHDGFNFAYEQKSGDFDVIVRHKSITPTSRWAKGGLMVRETLAEGSRNWNIVNATPPVATVDNNVGCNTVECNNRVTTDDVSGGWDSSRPAPNYPNAWVRLQRTGTLLKAYISADGQNWTQQASQDPSTVGAMTPLPSTVYVGICVTAHNNDPDPLLMPPDYGPLKFYNVAEFDNYNSSYVPLPPAARITATYNPATGNISVSWAPTGGRLLSSPVLGPSANWQPVGPANPATIPATGSAMFFRVANP